ncbi:hypothetical protein M6B38_314435 [Iris pallida]|uniref:Uncharacterized protein n=1 Tax=Iris pallida TaxID=29817 RepID=A0AAX6HGG9_IRIPA|nr:hypothetical protein M6B38_314435 [Iris pallida]
MGKCTCEVSVPLLVYGAVPARTVSVKSCPPHTIFSWSSVHFGLFVRILSAPTLSSSSRTHTPRAPELHETAMTSFDVRNSTPRFFHDAKGVPDVFTTPITADVVQPSVLCARRPYGATRRTAWSAVVYTGGRIVPASDRPRGVLSVEVS